MDLTGLLTSKMDGEETKGGKNDLTYVIFRFENKSIGPVPEPWIVNDLIEEYNECYWPKHLTTIQIASAMKEYSIERKETWPRFKGIVLDVYLDYMAASRACDLYKDTEASLKDDFQIEQYFKSQSNRFRHAEKSERIKLNKISKRSHEDKGILHESSTVIDKILQGPCRKRTLESIALIGLQADLQACIKKVEQKRADIELYTEKIVEKSTPNIMAEQDEHIQETNISEIEGNKEANKGVNKNTPNIMTEQDEYIQKTNICEIEIKEAVKNIKSSKNLISFNSEIKEPLNRIDLITVGGTTNTNGPPCSSPHTSSRSSHLVETQIFAEGIILNNSIIAQKNNDNIGHDAFISQLKGLKENINQCEAHFNSFIKESEPLKIQNSTLTTSHNSESKIQKLEQNVNLGWCLEHSDNVLSLRCSTHKAWICHICCEDDHPKNECKIITFENELETRKSKEVQLLQEESKNVSDKIKSLFELGNEKERKRNENIKKLKEMQEAMKKMICDINQLGNQMSFLKEVMSEGKKLEQKLNEKKDNVPFTTTISQLVSFKKSYLDILTESKKWCSEHLANNEYG